MSLPARSCPRRHACVFLARRQRSLWRGLFAMALPWAAGTVQAVTCMNNIPPTNPDSAYIVRADGTVTDRRTHLMWRQCMEGRSGPGCTGFLAATLSFPDALAAAEASTFAGHTDWRLPNIRELRSLVEYCAQSPTINADVFPNTSIVLTDTPRATFWSSSPYVASFSKRAWELDFIDGTELSDFPYSTTFFARFVRDDFDTIFASGFDR